MNKLWQVVVSSPGKKFLMALSGFGLVGFVIIHMMGNLQIFIPGHDGTLDGEALNVYAKLLHSSHEVLWGFRIALLALVTVHLATGISLALENRGSRPTKYAKERNAASLASRTMIVSGLIVVGFIVFHIMHFTVRSGAIDPNVDAAWQQMAGDPPKHDVFGMVVAGFSNPWVSTFYIVSVGLLCFHMSHGISSMFQSIGFRNRHSGPFLDFVSVAVSVVVFLGMSSVPTAVLLKFVQ